MNPNPLSLQILLPVPTYYTACKNCEFIFDQANLANQIHNKDINEYPDDLNEQYLKLMMLVKRLEKKYGQLLQIEIIDPISLKGVYYQLRHGIKVFPTFILGKATKIKGWRIEELEAHITEVLPH